MEEEQAAILIQSTQKGQKARKRVAQMKEDNSLPPQPKEPEIELTEEELKERCSTVIQNKYRQKVARKQVTETRNWKLQRQNAAVAIQSGFRIGQARKKRSLLQEKKDLDKSWHSSFADTLVAQSPYKLPSLREFERRYTGLSGVREDDIFSARSRQTAASTYRSEGGESEPSIVVTEEDNRQFVTGSVEVIRAYRMQQQAFWEKFGGEEALRDDFVPRVVEEVVYEDTVEHGQLSLHKLADAEPDAWMDSLLTPRTQEEKRLMTDSELDDRVMKQAGVMAGLQLKAARKQWEERYLGYEQPLTLQTTEEKISGDDVHTGLYISLHRQAMELHEVSNMEQNQQTFFSIHRLCQEEGLHDTLMDKNFCSVLGNGLTAKDPQIIETAAEALNMLLQNTAYHKTAMEAADGLIVRCISDVCNATTYTTLAGQTQVLTLLQCLSKGPMQVTVAKTGIWKDLITCCEKAVASVGKQAMQVLTVLMSNKYLQKMVFNEGGLTLLMVLLEHPLSEILLAAEQLMLVMLLEPYGQNSTPQSPDHISTLMVLVRGPRTALNVPAARPLSAITRLGWVQQLVADQNLLQWFLELLLQPVGELKWAAQCVSNLMELSWLHAELHNGRESPQHSMAHSTQLATERKKLVFAQLLQEDLPTDVRNEGVRLLAILTSNTHYMEQMLQKEYLQTLITSYTCLAKGQPLAGKVAHAVFRLWRAARHNPSHRELMLKCGMLGMMLLALESQRVEVVHIALVSLEELCITLAPPPVSGRTLPSPHQQQVKEQGGIPRLLVLCECYSVVYIMHTAQRIIDHFQLIGLLTENEIKRMTMDRIDVHRQATGKIVQVKEEKSVLDYLGLSGVAITVPKISIPGFSTLKNIKIF